jgi:hypothetical protein
VLRCLVGPSCRAVCGHHLLTLWVRIPQHECLPVVIVVCCQVEVFASRWSLIQLSPADCHVSEYNRESLDNDALAHWGLWCLGGKYSVIGIVSRLRAGRSGFRTPVRGKKFSFLQNWQDRAWRSPRFLHDGHHYVCYLAGVNLTRREVYSSHPTTAKVKNEWSYTSTPPICLQCVDTDNFTLFQFAGL